LENAPPPPQSRPTNNLAAPGAGGGGAKAKLSVRVELRSVNGRFLASGAFRLADGNSVALEGLPLRGNLGLRQRSGAGKDYEGVLNASKGVGKTMVRKRQPETAEPSSRRTKARSRGWLPSSGPAVGARGSALCARAAAPTEASSTDARGWDGPQAQHFKGWRERTARGTRKGAKLVKVLDGERREIERCGELRVQARTARARRCTARQQQRLFWKLGQGSARSGLRRPRPNLGARATCRRRCAARSSGPTRSHRAVARGELARLQARTSTRCCEGF